MEANKKIGYAIIVILIAIIAISNVVQIIRYDDAEKDWRMEVGSLEREIMDMIPNNLRGIEHFTDKLDVEYFNILSVEPVGFINYSLDYGGFRVVLYNVTFHFVNAKEVNGSLTVWSSDNYTYSVFMAFDVALANNREPMTTGDIYKCFVCYNAYQFYNIFYYEKVVTGRMD
jgi:hypothetical protein